MVFSGPAVAEKAPTHLMGEMAMAKVPKAPEPEPLYKAGEAADKNFADFLNDKSNKTIME
jgi:hypothetical protein